MGLPKPIGRFFSLHTRTSAEPTQRAVKTKLCTDLGTHNKNNSSNNSRTTAVTEQLAPQRPTQQSTWPDAQLAIRPVVVGRDGPARSRRCAPMGEPPLGSKHVGTVSYDIASSSPHPLATTPSHFVHSATVCGKPHTSRIGLAKTPASCRGPTTSGNASAPPMGTGAINLGRRVHPRNGPRDAATSLPGRTPCVHSSFTGTTLGPRAASTRRNWQRPQPSTSHCHGRPIRTQVYQQPCQRGTFNTRPRPGQQQRQQQLQLEPRTVHRH